MNFKNLKNSIITYIDKLYKYSIGLKWVEEIADKAFFQAC